MLFSLAFASLALLQPGAQCAAAGRSIDQDPAGLNVRAGPSPRARVLGRLHSVLDAEAEQRYGPIFAIREVRDGWVRITDAAAEVEGFDGEVRRNYTGPGWVSAALVEPTIVSARAGDPGSRGYAGPSFSAAVSDPDGLTNVERMRRGRQNPRIVACRGAWVQLDYTRSGRLGGNGRWADFPARERQQARAWFRSGAPGE
ncbi:MAG TPA: SH3 domain-containing protein [Allosphingosinicella sp.]|nr:SH3 domain-containing protein [Allosphingosinicella sp.]